MDKRRQGYEAFIAQQLRSSGKRRKRFQGERLNRMIAKVQAYLEAAGDLTQDELALIAEYVKRDLGNYDEGRKDEQVEESAFMLALKDTAWSWLADVTDRTQVGVAGVGGRAGTQGVYRAGTGWGSGCWCAITASGAIPCCTRSSLAPARSAGADEYHREPLSP